MVLSFTPVGGKDNVAMVGIPIRSKFVLVRARRGAPLTPLSRRQKTPGGTGSERTEFDRRH
eukprot:1727592-Rhodomonas_salina.1